LELIAGYKVTEIGVIPEEWDAKPLSEVLEKARLGGNYPNQDAESDFPLMKMGNIARGVFDFSAIEYISPATSPEAQHRLAKGDVLFNTRNTLDLVGKVAVWRDELPVAYYNSNLLRLEFNASEIASSEYANYWFNTATAISNLRALATGTTSVAAIYTRDLLRLSIAVPPLPEQSAIATALGDVDALLAGQDALIAKKRAIKQGAMQELLTGKRRLPGFSGDWEEGSFASLTRQHSGNSTLIKGKLPSEPISGLYPAYSASGQDVWCEQFEHEGMALIVSAVGSRCGKTFLARGRWSAIANTHVIWPNEKMVDPRFLHCFLNDEDFWVKGGTGQPFVLVKLSLLKTLARPGIEEQRAIMEVLSDMDDEITALEAQRAKIAQLKQGMMQALLTGRIRLV